MIPEPFVVSNALLADPPRLRERAAENGYLFFRNLLAPEPLLRARVEILTICNRHGWLAPGFEQDLAVASPGVLYREGHPEYMAAYDDIQRLEAFHALAHEPALLAALESLFAEPVLVHPRNIARVMFPQNNQYTTPAHQDFVHIQGTTETWTAWFPLGDCPRTLGGLEVQCGSHRFGPFTPRAAYGAGGLGVDTDHLGLAWHGGDFRCGDVLLFHSLSVHRGVDNHTRDRIRLSVDLRFQAVSEPVTESSLLPHFNRLPWDEIYLGWTRPELQYYWRKLSLSTADFTRRFHEAARPPAAVG